MSHEGSQPLFRGWSRKLALVVVLAVCVVAAVSTESPSAARSALAPTALARARVIGAEVDSRYRQAPGRKLAVTEVTTTGVVSFFTLVTDWLEPPRRVPADSGVYFAICSERALCPYPGRSAAWPAGAYLPRRQALELALRTFLETPVNLVLVALPTAEPVWVVFERGDLLTGDDAPAALELLASNPAIVDASAREFVERFTRPHLFRPIPILPPPPDTIVAVRLLGP